MCLSTDQIHAIFIVAIAFVLTFLFFAVQAYFEKKEMPNPKHKKPSPKQKYDDDIMAIAQGMYGKYQPR